MTTGTTASYSRARPRRRWAGGLARWIWGAVPIAVGVIAYLQRDSLEKAADLITRATLWWLLPAVLAIGGVYLCRAYVYGVPLELLGFSFLRRFLWSTALVSTSLHQLIPTGGASGYAFLTYALHQRGVPGGQASLIALIDTLSYAVAVATLVLASLAYLAVAGGTGLGRLSLGLVPGLSLLGVACYVYHLQRRRRRLVLRVLRLKNRAARLLRRRWPDEPVRRFLDDYFEAKKVIGRRPDAFARMVAFQYLALACDTAALYAAFLALGLLPNPWVVIMGFVLSMAGGAVAGVPGGGGSFEVIMASFLATHGLGSEQAIAATILYRVAAFWIPVLASLVLLFRLRRRRREIRASAGTQAPRSPSS